MCTSIPVTYRRRANPALVADSICDHLSIRETIDGNAVKAEEDALFAILESCGVSAIDVGVSDTPDGDFIEDVVKLFPLRGKHLVPVVGRPKLHSRRRDADWAIQYFKAHDIAYAGNGDFSDDATIELGDVIIDHDLVFVGCSQRTNDAGRAGLRRICSDTPLKIVEVAVNGGPHLDNFASVVGERLVLADPRFIDTNPFKKQGYRVIETAKDAEWGLASALRIQDFERGEHIICQGKDGDPHIEELRALRKNLLFADYTHHRRRQGGMACKLAMFYTET